MQYSGNYRASGGPYEDINHQYGVLPAVAPSPMITLASITDGTSNTMSFSEESSKGVNPWNLGGTLCACQSYFPPNFRQNAQTCSYHPGGVNSAFCDGSVHFIRNSINSWPLSNYGTSISPSWYTESFTNNGFFIYFTAKARLGVWQAISTRAMGEVVSSDSY
jgi:prepilin-type processing-associated H-X9-DG protein